MFNYYFGYEELRKVKDMVLKSVHVFNDRNKAVANANGACVFSLSENAIKDFKHGGYSVVYH